MPYFFVLCLLFLQSVALANDEWELAKQDKERNIQVYTRPQLDSPYHEFRAQTLVEQPLKTVWAVLVDINAWPQWLARIKQVKILKKEPEKTWVYVVYKLPYPFVERDMVLYSHVQKLVNGQIVVQTQALEHYPVPKEIQAKRIRLTEFKSTWRLSSLSPTVTKVELWGSGNPESFVPAMIFNYNLADEPLQSLKQLRKMVLRPQYRRKK